MSGATWKFIVGVVAVVALGAAAVLGSCNNLTCGPNTIEQNGQCVAESTPPGADCGPGTYFDKTSGRCLNGTLGDGGGICGENTVLVIDDAGNRFCVGTGSSTDCTRPLPCATPTGGRISMCGRIFDIEDSTPLGDGVKTDYQKVEIRVYDPIGFIGNPAGTNALATAYPDSCGRFKLENIDTSMLGSGKVALATKDFKVTTGTQPDDYVLTGIAAIFNPGQIFTGMRAWTFRRATDQAWATQAGFAAGTTFSSRGVWIPIFMDGAAVAPLPNTPASGVTAVVKDPSTGTKTIHAGDDWYFMDTNPLTRHTLNTNGVTSANGTALFTNVDGMVGGLQNGSGMGAEPATLCWPIDNMGIVGAVPTMFPGAAFVQEKVAGTINCN